MSQPIPVNINPPTPLVKLGDKFTIAGVKIVGPGRFITNCKPGEETPLINSDKPSVFQLTGEDCCKHAK